MTSKYDVDFTDATWSKSSRSGGSCDNCVEVAMVGDVVGVRDSKNLTGPTLVFDRAEWSAFLGGVVDGEFDLRA